VRIGTRRRIGDEAFPIEDGAHRSSVALFSESRGNPRLNKISTDDDHALM